MVTAGENLKNRIYTVLMFLDIGTVFCRVDLHQQETNIFLIVYVGI